jgi:hypothetical protein
MSDIELAEGCKTALGMQMKAALATLKHCIDSCPEAAWDEPQGDAPFSQVVFHTLFYADFYLGRDSAPFKDQAFHAAHREIFADYEEMEDRKPMRHYARPFCLGYLSFCLEKLESVLAAETADSLKGESGISFRKGSRMELYIYNTRHVQHHAAQLGLRLQILTGKELPWFGRGG